LTYKKGDKKVSPNLQTLSLRMDYPVVFTRGVFNTSNLTLHDTIVRLESKRHHVIVVVVDSNVSIAWSKLIVNIQNYIAFYHNVMVLRSSPMILLGGELCKNKHDNIAKLHRWMFDLGLDRQSVLLAIGGGALLDMTGYAAATFHRGIRIIRLPTTVLAQNDAGLGVKNGINLFNTKNLIGCFSAPFAVISDFDFLNTLDSRDKKAGLAEAVKVALIRDQSFFQWLQLEAEALSCFSPRHSETMIRRCAALHLAHITEGGDPFEFGSARPLDFGHWAAHKLEVMTHFRLRHGEAVAIGVALDAFYSYEIGLLKQEALMLICRLLQKFGFSLWDQVLDCPEGRELLIEGIMEFRQHLGGELTLIMLADIGHGVQIHSIDFIAMNEALKNLGVFENK